MTGEATEVIRLNSVQIEDNSRGTTVTAKAYGATIHEAEDEAVTSIQRLRLRLQTISKRQAAAEELVIALAKLLVAIDPVLEQVPDEAVRAGYQALVSAGYQP